jgi:hypothetical protein
LKYVLYLFNQWDSLLPASPGNRQSSH